MMVVVAVEEQAEQEQVEEVEGEEVPHLPIVVPFQRQELLTHVMKGRDGHLNLL